MFRSVYFFIFHLILSEDVARGGYTKPSRETSSQVQFTFFLDAKVAFLVVKRKIVFDFNPNFLILF